jgi:hypothetical protein
MLQASVGGWRGWSTWSLDHSWLLWW